MTYTIEQAIPSTTSIFQQDQTLAATISYWDTPFTALENNVASNGIVMDVREPYSSGVTTLSALKTALGAAAASGAYAAFTNATNSKPVVSNGVTDNLINYWAGGAPGRHGASVSQRVAYHFKCCLRPVTGREWWSTSTAPNFQVAFAGNGWVRITKTIAGVTTDLTSGAVAINGTMTEADFLANGLKLSDAITTMNPADCLDIYYIQDGEPWGGFVFKAVASGDTAANAPIISSSIFDTGTQPTRRTFSAYAGIRVSEKVGSASTATIDLPLLNASVDDDIGWEFVKSSADDPGLLRYHVGDGTTYDIKRSRLVQIQLGFSGEPYTAFTGFIDSFSAPDNGVIHLTCMSFEQRAVEQFVKNYPDRISYMCHNYKRRKGTVEPVYDITAYDNWPLEYALRDLLTRAGIDQSTTRQPLQVDTSTGTLTAVTMAGDVFSKFRARTAPILVEGGANIAGKQIRIERPVHYGNAGAGYDSAFAADDEYLFKPENTKDIWSACRELVDRYGYDFWFDKYGVCVLKPANNFHAVWDFNSTFGGSPSVKSNPNAYSGTYLEWTNTVALITKSVTAARIDLCVPRGVNHGSWAYTVKTSLGVTVSSGTINPALAAGSADEFFYDYRSNANGINNTVVTLYSGDYGTYTVTLQSSGTGALTRRLDGFLLWHTDPLRPRFSNALSGQINATEIQAQSTMDEMRNYVLVVGRRKATVTDSTKFNQGGAVNNPMNLDAEFVVKAAVDVDSITNPSAVNFIGYSKESIIYDTSITDNDFAGYIANTFIYRYRLPKPGAVVSHSLFTPLRRREPIYVVETKFDTLDAQSVLWVTAMEHEYGARGATTRIEATSYAPIPAYTIREDIDIDANFAGAPVSNVKITYNSVTGELRTNLAPSEEYVSDSNDIVSYSGVSVTAGSPEYLDMQTGKSWPPIPGTVFIKPAGGVGTAGMSKTTTYTQANAGAISNFNNSGARLYNLQSITSVVIDIQAPTGAPGAAGGLQTIKTLTLDSDTTKEWYYQYNSQTEVLTVYHNPPSTGVTLSNPPRFSVNVTINWYAKNKYSSTDWLTNTPYHHFMNVDYRTGASQKRIYLPWKLGDGSANYTRNTGVTSYDVTYRRLGPVDGSSNFLDPYGGKSPFYDPYTSELGYLVNVQFDALVSGLYRISVRSVYDDTIVAWLTEPTADATDKEKHWAYFGAGSGKILSWDGVDDSGAWNRRQSDLYASAAAGAFEQEERPVIGKGFYVWNREEDRSSSFPPLALIAGNVAATGEPVFGQGTYAKWYVKFEAINDNLQTIADNNIAGTPSKAVPRVVDSTSLNATYNPDCVIDSGTATGTQTTTTLQDTSKTWIINQWKGYTLNTVSGTGSGQSKQIISNTANTLTVTSAWGTTPVNGSTGYQVVSPSAIIYTHLPEPTKVELHSIADYINASAYDETSPPTSDAGNWQTTPNTDAVFNNQKPVRMRFNVMSRPGTLWSGKESFAPFKIFRVAKLIATIFDQSVLYDGAAYPGTTTEKRTIANRKFNNTEHTIVYSDEDWRYNTSLKQLTSGSGFEWVFLPRYFKKDFRGITDEPIQFGDYLQLEEVPQWQNSRQIAGQRSRLQLAFMNYIFYLSAYTQDKSGRFVWCIDRSFLDRSKIIKNAFADWWDPSSVTTPRAAASSSTYKAEWPVDLITQQRRTIISRQWSDEGTWRADQNTLWGFGGAGSVGYELLRHKWKDHYPASGAGTLNGVNWSSLTGGLQIDQHTKWYRDGRSFLPSDFGSPNLTRQLGNAAFTSAGTALGKWQWEDRPTWIPCITRDFHGYFRIPPMVDPTLASVNYRVDYAYGTVDPRASDPILHEGNDPAMAQVWNSPVYDMNESYSSAGTGKVRFWPAWIVDNKAGPLKGIVNANTCDYLRQDELLHYEDFRGIYSRGPHPGDQPKKVSPALPYYINMYTYGGMTQSSAYKNPAYPLIKADPTTAGWWDMRFRYEYVWESDTLFPTDTFGNPNMVGVNPYVAQIFQYNLLNSLRMDGGAWVGWKDDIATSGTGDALYALNFTGTHGETDVFATGYMPVATGPQLREAASGGVISTDMIFHLVLVNERRSRVI